MWTLSGFGDEIDPDLGVQLATLTGLGIGHLELRSVWGKNVLALSDEELDSLKRGLDAHGVKVSAIASPIGKIDVRADFAPHLEQFRRALDVRQMLAAPYIRIFSFYIPSGDNPVKHRSAVLHRLEQLVRLAEERGAVLGHENERHIYGEQPEQCHDLLTALASPCFRAIWDPANFVAAGVTRPHDAGYALIRPYLAYIQIKDAVAATGAVVLPGEGDGQIRQTLAALRADGFDGYVSLEPHLAHAGDFGGFSGPALFTQAANAVAALLRNRTARGPSGK